LPKLLLVRHGMTEANQVKKFTGCTDIELAEEGYRQAEKLRDRLAGQQIDAAYCSDLRRAVVTAEIILSGHALEPEICPEIREIDYGVVEGLTFKEISERFPELSDMIARVSPVLSFPGGEGFHELTARAVGFIEKLKNHEGSQTVLIVSHGGMLRTLTCQLLDIGQEHWSKFRFDNASLTVVDVYPHRVILSLLNDTSHLGEEVI
jgi:alpha-ribazole phosphatase